jgi:hypothetical protein
VVRIGDIMMLQPSYVKMLQSQPGRAIIPRPGDRGRARQVVTVDEALRPACADAGQRSVESVKSVLTYRHVVFTLAA